jgi:hypothetical protein
MAKLTIKAMTAAAVVRRILDISRSSSVDLDMTPDMEGDCVASHHNPDHFCRYRAESSDIICRRLIVTGRQISGAREPRDMDGGTNDPDIISGPVSDDARLLLAFAGDATASANTIATNAPDLIAVIAFILAPTSSSSAARRRCRSGDTR